MPRWVEVLIGGLVVSAIGLVGFLVFAENTDGSLVVPLVVLGLGNALLFVGLIAAGVHLGTEHLRR